MTFIFFIYGLAFFALGTAIFVYPTRMSAFWLAGRLKLVAAFAIIHGATEWADMFLLIQPSYELKVLRAFLLPASFFFLLQFGFSFLGRERPGKSLYRAAPFVFLLFWPILASSGPDFFLRGDIWARYLLGAPGIFLTAYAFAVESRSIGSGRLNIPDAASSDLLASAVCLSIYGVLSGLIVPDGPVLFASLLNYSMFRDLTGLPVQVLRSACAVVIMYHTVKVLNLFDNETCQRLKESEETFRGIFDNVQDGIVLSDGSTGVVIAANAKACELFGRSEPELKTRGVYDLFPPEILQSGSLAEELTLKRSPCPAYADVVSSRVRFSGRDCTLSVLRDLSYRRSMEDRNARQLAKLSALRSIDRVISSTLDMQVSLDVLLQHVTALLRVDAADILLFRPHLQILEFASGRGFRTSALKYTRLKIGEGYAGAAVLSRELVHLSDLKADGVNFKRSHEIEGEGFVSYHGVPLLAKGMVKGVLEVFHRSSEERDAEWVDFLQTLAGQAAIAIDNASLYENLQRTNLDLTRAYDETIAGWSRALDLRDKETEGHSLRVTELALRIAGFMGVSEHELADMKRGALLHDIGKMGIPDRILLKPGPLDSEEAAIMRTHPVLAYELLSGISFLKSAIDIPYCHHEQWDGGGYPRRIEGSQIPLAARIFAIADIFDALSSDRPYRPAWPSEKVFEHIRSLSGSHLDPEVVAAFLEIVQASLPKV